MDGVTRVTLSKSDKPATQASGNAVAADAATNENGCGAGEPPAFEVVLFFEHSTVPSSVQDINVTPSAGTAQTTSSSSTTSNTPTTQPASGVTTPPADPAQSGTATPASTPQGGDAK